MLSHTFAARKPIIGKTCGRTILRRSLSCCCWQPGQNSRSHGRRARNAASSVGENCGRLAAARSAHYFSTMARAWASRPASSRAVSVAIFNCSVRRPLSCPMRGSLRAARRGRQSETQFEWKLSARDRRAPASRATSPEMMALRWRPRLGDTTGAFAPGGNGASNGTVVRMRRPGGEKKRAEFREGNPQDPARVLSLPGGMMAAARS